MTALSDRPSSAEPAELVTATIDGTEVRVPPGTLVIRAAERAGIQIPRFCDHPLLAPVGACRQCLVEVEGQRKPLASCTTTITEGMEVRTQLGSEIAEKAQRGVMELLLINHPLDCPICDKGGECPLQNQAMTAGRPRSRFTGPKRTYAKPVPLSSAVLLDRERCVLCARCTRFADQIAGDPLIELADRGALQQVSTADGVPFDSYFSGNAVQICPVGALTGTAYRFRARPFDLVSTPSTCEHCASGCAQRTDHRRGKVLRRLAADDPAVNEEWNCDKGRWAFAYTAAADRLTTPLVRDRHGQLREVSWAQALRAAADGLQGARGRAGVLTGGRITAEDAYAYVRFARTVLGTNDIDFRSRPHSAEETAFLTRLVAARADDLTYDALVTAPTVLLAGFEPEEESPIVFLRLRRAVRATGTRIHTIAPWRSPGVEKLNGTVLPAAPGDEATVLDDDSTATLLGDSGSVIIVGERLATAPGALSAAARLAERTGARLVWIPRRAGDRGAVEVGALPTLLPGGRPVTDATARLQVAGLWQARDLPSLPGRDSGEILSAATAGRLDALLVGGVDPADLPDPAAAIAALDAVGFLVSLEIRTSAVTERADVVLPVAAATEKAGMFLDWEGRARPFPAALADTGRLSDHRVLDALAQAAGVSLNCREITDIRAQLGRLGPWTGPRPDIPAPPESAARTPGPGEAVLSTWHLLLDDARLLDGEPYLAGTAHASVARCSAATANTVGLTDGHDVELGTDSGTLTLPLLITDMVDGVVWVPANSVSSHVRSQLHAESGDVVAIRPAEGQS
ncbi:NADH-quinone oxidoreductase subunit G [Gordonia oryzae]|uniref:NADH-quinone oxidoreductase n=1 Tax=Gordonia oryzae TaxID=2487349 RepID=A0A3N4GB36_9ACTN|nr:NADH-quinone oxidoreductase subunit G [Gordonia oryzae]RPA58597.1 NADH-quinone oxidoreductase subunit G [Gordonia oryzae]